jgi:hypothetical protein
MFQEIVKELKNDGLSTTQLNAEIEFLRKMMTNKRCRNLKTKLI